VKESTGGALPRHGLDSLALVLFVLMSSTDSVLTGGWGSGLHLSNLPL